MRRLDLNADIGEISGPEGRALDQAILSAVTSCNIACGGHAGDADSMAATLEMAKKLGVRAGAHPSYPDREGFGRRSVVISESDLKASLKDQVKTLKMLADERDITLTHLKPHGALYNGAAQDALLARIVADVTVESGIGTLVGLPNSEMAKAAEEAGLDFLGEGFADRSYELDGSLTPRDVDGAVLESEVAQKEQALRLADGAVVTRTGPEIALEIQTICLHGDTKGAWEAAVGIRKALLAHGYELGAPDV